MDTIWDVWLDPILGLAEIGLLFAAVVLTITQFKRSRASSYIERFNSIEALESRVAVDRWLQDQGTSSERLAALESDPRLRTHVRQFANLFQELGAAYQFRVAHKKTVRVLFDTLVVAYWERLLFWVQDYRASSDPTLYKRFEYLYREIKKRERVEERRVDYVVAYGSLMDPTSAAAGIGRPVPGEDLVPAWIEGWERRWSARERVVLHRSGESVDAAFLDLAPAPGRHTTGAIIRVTGSELARLRRREKNYEAKDLTYAIRLIGDRPLGPAATAWCFVGRASDGRATAAAQAPILGDYLERVARAAERIDPTLGDELRSSAESSGLAMAHGGYAFVDPDQASLV